jgi:hypothetical protein
MRRIAALIGILAVVACAGQNQPRHQVTGDNLGSAVARAPFMTDDEFADYVSERADKRLADICGSQRTLSGQFACVRDALLRGFDTTGEARRNCDPDVPIERMMRCAIMGSVGYELAVDAKLEQASNYNWADPEAAFREALGIVARQTVSSCLVADLSKVDACVIQRVADSFSLSENQVTICTDVTNTDKTLQCMVRVHLIQRFEAAFQRMGPGAGQQA